MRVGWKLICTSLNWMLVTLCLVFPLATSYSTVGGKNCTRQNSHNPENGVDLFRVSKVLNPPEPKAGEQVELGIRIEYFDTENGRDGEWHYLTWHNLMEHHSRKIHVQVVSGSLDYLWHIHPDESGSAVSSWETTFKVSFTPPRAGVHRVLLTALARADPDLNMCVSEDAYHSHQGSEVGAIISKTIEGVTVYGYPGERSVGPRWDVGALRPGLIGVPPGPRGSISVAQMQDTEDCSAYRSPVRFDASLSLQLVAKNIRAHTALGLSLADARARRRWHLQTGSTPGVYNSMSLELGTYGCVLFQIEINPSATDRNYTMELYMGAEAHAMVAPLDTSQPMHHTHGSSIYRGADAITCAHTDFPTPPPASFPNVVVGSFPVYSAGIYLLVAWLKVDGKIYKPQWNFTVGNCGGGISSQSLCDGFNTKTLFGRDPSCKRDAVILASPPPNSDESSTSNDGLSPTAVAFIVIACLLIPVALLVCYWKREQLPSACPVMFGSGGSVTAIHAADNKQIEEIELANRISKRRRRRQRQEGKRQNRDVQQLERRSMDDSISAIQRNLGGQDSMGMVEDVITDDSEDDDDLNGNSISNTHSRDRDSVVGHGLAVSAWSVNSSHGV